MIANRSALLSLLIRGIASILLILLGGGAVLFVFLHISSPAFAASRGQHTVIMCAAAPSAIHCDHQDPEVQGCARDARTIDQADIQENGTVIGRVERRWSPTCQSWWGRVFDTRLGSPGNLSIEIDGVKTTAFPTFVSTPYSILYSWMIFDASSMQQVPEITGLLEIDGVTPAASATLLAIPIPGSSAIQTPTQH